MSLNIDAMKAKLNQFTRQNTRGDALWRPQEGKTVIRIVPWKDNPQNPFIELYFHYLGNKTHLSPTTHGNPDPILEFAEALAAGGTRDDYAQARPFRPKLRTFVPMIVRGEESKGVRFMSFGKTVYTELLQVIADPDYGDITDVQTGRDITLTYIPQQKSDTNFAKTSIMVKPNQTPLHEDAQVVQRLLNDQPDIFALFKEPSYNELKVFLERYLDPDSANTMPAYDHGDSDEDTTSQVSSPSVTTQRSQETTTNSVKNMIDEFDEVFS